MDSKAQIFDLGSNKGVPKVPKMTTVTKVLVSLVLHLLL